MLNSCIEQRILSGSECMVQSQVVLPEMPAALAVH